MKSTPPGSLPFFSPVYDIIIPYIEYRQKGDSKNPPPPGGPKAMKICYNQKVSQIYIYFLYLIELDVRPEDLVNDVRSVVDLLMHHEREDSHLGSAAVVKLDCTLNALLFLRPRLPLLLEGVDHRHVPGEGVRLLVHHLRKTVIPEDTATEAAKNTLVDVNPFETR